MGIELEVLRKELEHFDRIKNDLLKTDKGKFALIKGERIIGTFNRESDAYKKGIELYGIEPFLIKCISESEPVQRIPALTLGLLHVDL